VSVKVVTICHVEPGTIQNGRIIPGFERTEGVAKTLPRIVEFGDRCNIPIGFVLTPQAMKLSDVDLKGHEVGLHLHPMDPLLRKEVQGRLRTAGDCLGRYTAPDQALLISTARRMFEGALGHSPRLFVAGRWSEDAATLRILREQGFTHDGSPLPGHRTACADWSAIPRLAQPYAPDALDPQRRGSERYVYIPVYQGLWGHYFTPETIRDLGISYFKAALKEAQIGKADTVHIYFHSPLGLDPNIMAAFEQVVLYARDQLHLEFVVPTSLTPSSGATSAPFPPVYWVWMDLRLMKSLFGAGQLGERIMGRRSRVPDWDGMSETMESTPRVP